MMGSDSPYRELVENAPVLMWMSGPDQLRTYVNRYWLDFTGRPAESDFGNGWAEGVHPEDVRRCLGSYSENFERRQEFRVEYRLRRHDGEFRWVRDIGVPRFEVDGSFSGFVGSCFDITEHKATEETLARSNACLIESQEQERTWIARELHDDIGSSLAILGIEILRAGQPVSGSPGRKHPGSKEIYEKLQALALRVSRLSHQLHSPMLEYMGLAKAIQTECREFSAKCPIPVSCSCNDIPARLDSSIALSFFRVVQETLQNAARHSRASKISLDLVATAEAITLTVSDDGVGFDVEQSRLAEGLGLISMRERMRLAGGAFEICSQPGNGTKITCSAPVASSETSQRSLT